MAASEVDYFTMLEDSFSSDPMLAGLAVQVHSCCLSSVEWLIIA